MSEYLEKAKAMYLNEVESEMAAWTTAAAAIAQAEAAENTSEALVTMAGEQIKLIALTRIAASLEKLVILQEAATDEDSVKWTNRGT